MLRQFTSSAVHFRCHRVEGAIMKTYVVPFTIVIVLACSVLLVANALSRMQQTSGVRITNKTKAISAEGTDIGFDKIHLRLRNNYNKDITAFVISIGNLSGTRFSYKEEFIYSETDKVLAPGESYNRNISLPSSLKGRRDQEIAIQAVIFADKTNDGDQDIIGEIEEERLGEKVQIQRILPKLKQALSFPDVARNMLISGQFEAEIASDLDASESDTLAALDTLSPQIATIRQWPKGKIPEQVNNGLLAGKESVLHKLQKIKNDQQNQSPSAFRRELTRLIAHYEKLVPRL